MYDPESTSGQTRPAWTEQLSAEDIAVLGGLPASELPAAAADVVVIGAGIAGLSTAYHLRKHGLTVLVIDKGKIASGETGRTTAHLASALDDRLYRLEAMHGARAAALAARSHAAAIDSIASIAAAEGIACDFARVDGYLFASSDAPHAAEEIEREYEAAQRAGLAVGRADAAPLPFTTGPCLRFAGQAQMQPLRYMAGLARALGRMGTPIVTGVRAAGVAESGPIKIDLADGRSLAAGAVVVATNTPVNDLVAIHTKQAPYRTYAIGVPIPKGSVARALYWDTEDPYHYVRVAGDDDLLIVGGEDHKVGQERAPQLHWSELEGWTLARFPMAESVRYFWSGQIQEPADGLAFIGKNPGNERVFIATGDSGNGVTHGALAGMLIADLILERPNAWAAVYDPSRKITRPASAKRFVRENINVAAHYAEWLSPGDRAGLRVEPGHGAVIRRGVRRVALYVDEAGEPHECSATCPHLGCLVAWNHAERSWDCPCHGSRFDPYGKLLIGPAVRDLEPITSEAPRLEAPAPAPDAEE
jgi:glycine/D-amino acid oxidase-like deaminating enzyme/nitrite reductase/ring-hydroxylating ferredoxin subunit